MCIKTNCGNPTTSSDGICDSCRNTEQLYQYCLNKKKAVQCPVCHGIGLVQNGFYTAIGVGPYTTNSTRPEVCKSCNGQGYLVI